MSDKTLPAATARLKIDILTLFPEMFAPLAHSIVGRARKEGILDIAVRDIRTYPPAHED